MEDVGRVTPGRLSSALGVKHAGIMVGSEKDYTDADVDADSSHQDTRNHPTQRLKACSAPSPLRGEQRMQLPLVVHEADDTSSILA